MDARRLDRNDIQIGQKVDIRDLDYVWCQGEVKVIFESANREPCLGIGYIGVTEKRDEIIQRGSPRLAQFGTFSTRTDIPTYVLNPLSTGITKLNFLERDKNYFKNLLKFDET